MFTVQQARCILSGTLQAVSPIPGRLVLCIGWVLFSDVSGLWSLVTACVGLQAEHNSPNLQSEDHQGQARCIRHMTRAFEVSGYSVTSSRRLY